MIDYGDEHKNLDTIVTKGKYAGRIYYCEKPFKVEGTRYYLGGDVRDWKYFGGGPELPESVLMDYIQEYIVKERMFIIEQIVRQNQDKNYIIYDAGDGTWEIMKRKEGTGSKGAAGGAASQTGGASSLPDF